MPLFQRKKLDLSPGECKSQALVPIENITPADLERVEKEFDFSDLTAIDGLFMKHYILNGGNGTRAVMAAIPGIAYNVAKVKANAILRKLRGRKDFWDMLGLGYQDLAEIIATLKKEKPDKAIDVIMKVNKEDTQIIDLNGNITIATEPDLD